MQLLRSKFRKSFFGLAAFAPALAIAAWSNVAYAQSCCAGTGAVTPGRLALHEWALVGLQAKAGAELGSFDGGGHYRSNPSGASELDLEQDLFGAVRVFKRAQIALLVPLVETRRTSQGTSEFGGGIGDVNASARYDFTIAGASRFMPGIAALAGLTLPTGRAADASGLGPLATGATGIGTFQINAGLAVEQTFGPWLVNASVLFAQRTARTVGGAPNQIHERLGSQWTLLSAVAYTFPSEIALAGSASYVVEGDATINGIDTIGTAHRLPTLTFSGVVPVTDAWRLQGAIYDNLQIAPLGLNQPAGAGILLTVVHSWS
ncbi:MAG: hypothetical protein ABI461_14890 [Polyangiaceae bacterium]